MLRSSTYVHKCRFFTPVLSSALMFKVVAEGIKALIF